MVLMDKDTEKTDASQVQNRMGVGPDGEDRDNGGELSHSTGERTDDDGVPRGAGA
jgi:hypothetical protein